MDIKSDKGAMVLYVLIAMFVFTAVAVGIFVRSANKQQMQLEAIEHLRQVYNDNESAAEAYQKYIGGEVIPISTEEQLKKIGDINENRNW